MGVKRTMTASDIDQPGLHKFLSRRNVLPTCARQGEFNLDRVMRRLYITESFDYHDTV